jgi:dimethylamine/trimethylamine dehydrogenase
MRLPCRLPSMIDPARYAPLFSPLRIGPVTAPNRFFQVAHCNGMGHRMPQALARLREVKAEGGWGVVCTEEVEIHPSGDLSPCFEGRLWDEHEVPGLALMAESVKRHGALAAIQLTHNGVDAPNWYSRLTPIGPRSQGVIGGSGFEPMQTRAMDRADIRALRSWHRQAALRARDAGFDIVYVYAGHGLSLPFHFLSARFNDRDDEYGGALAQRLRLLRELLEDTREAIGDRCAVALRLSIDEGDEPDAIRADGEGAEIIRQLAELPDLWDVNLADWSRDSLPSRFGGEGFQEPYFAAVKSLTSKPVVGVGRYTSPDRMLRLITAGTLDFIGAARPSIADPFLPAKIRRGEVDAIRECIGCNICVAADNRSVPIRCTQNPTMGEEWRRGWHPEIIAPRHADERVLVVGAGPCGLEAARALGQRGYPVLLAEAEAEPGGHVRALAALPGMAAWRRVVDWRIDRLKHMPEVALYLGNRLDADDVVELDVQHVLVATGARWRADGAGRNYPGGLPGHLAPPLPLFGVEEVLAGAAVPAHVAIVDDDFYLMAALLAEKLALGGHRVELITRAPLPAMWSQNTLEQARTEARLRTLGVGMHTQCTVAALLPDGLRLDHAGGGGSRELAVDGLLAVGDRAPQRALYDALRDHPRGRFATLALLGDADGPGLLAQAVFAGHRAARELGVQEVAAVPFRRELAQPATAPRQAAGDPPTRYR